MTVHSYSSYTNIVVANSVSYNYAGRDSSHVITHFDKLQGLAWLITTDIKDALYDLHA